MSRKIFSDRISNQFIDGPSSVSGVIIGVFTQIARKYLFIDALSRVKIYICFVILLSLIGEFISLPDHYYFVQKNNIFNRFGTKIGWFWNCFLLVPFIWLTSLLHHGSRKKAFCDLCRLVVATFIFENIERNTAFCHGAYNSSRNDCTNNKGKWIPGFDISGHSFILIYSILIINEEACSFRNWPSSPRQNANNLNTHDAHLSYKISTKIIQCLFILLLILHVFWEFQLVITLLYYHTISHKIIGAIVGICCWFITYRIWYKIMFPFAPIRRKAKTF